MVTLQSGTPSCRGRVMVIEDDPANRLFFTDYLTYCGYQVCALPDGLDLLPQLKAFQPQVLLLDLRLPEIDGYTLLRQIRATAPWQHLPVAIVSGYAFETDREAAFAAGAHRYLTKPIRLKDLAETVADLMPPQEDGG